MTQPVPKEINPASAMKLRIVFIHQSLFYVSVSNKPALPTSNATGGTKLDKCHAREMRWCKKTVEKAQSNNSGSRFSGRVTRAPCEIG